MHICTRIQNYSVHVHACIQNQKALVCSTSEVLQQHAQILNEMTKTLLVQCIHIHKIYDPFTIFVTLSTAEVNTDKMVKTF